MARHLHRLAAGRRNPVDVVDALADFGAARLHAAVVRQRLGDVIHRAVRSPHRPVAVVTLVGQQLREPAAREIADPQIGGVAAAIVLARPHGRMAIEHERFSIGRIAAPVAPVERQRLLLPAVDRHLIQRGHVGEGAVAPRGAKDHAVRIARPADDIVAAGMPGQAPRRASRRRDDEHVVVAVTIRREGDPLSVGREARIDVARPIVGQAQRTGAVLIRGPDVAEVAEGDPAGVVIGMARKPDRTGGQGLAAREQDERANQAQRGCRSMQHHASTCRVRL